MTGILMASVGNSYGSAPINTVAPVVSGTATVGQTLSTTNGTWTGAPAPTFTYQWQRTGSNIGGATSSTYVLVAADAGNTIRCVVTATNSVAPSGVSANSNSTASVAATVPGAPTGVSASAGTASATISFSAPASNGGSAITVYTVTSSPGGYTNTGASSPITVSNIPGNTSYTFTVTATNAIGTGPASSASNSVAIALWVGQPLQGGYFAGKYSLGGTTYNLIVAPLATGQSSQQFSTNTSSGYTATNSDGLTNSNNSNNSNFPAAQWTRSRNIGGYTDWYLASINELCTVYYFLKPGTATNDTASGSNPNAVSPQPVSTNFTSGNPAQTTATAFRTGGAEALGTGRYYTSNPAGYYAFQQIFSNGSQVYIYGNRTLSLGVRAIRKMVA